MPDLFVDYSPACNTIQSRILTKTLQEHFELNNNLMGWILDFLTKRSQRVKVNGVLSDPKCFYQLVYLKVVFATIIIHSAHKHVPKQKWQ